MYDILTLHKKVLCLVNKIISINWIIIFDLNQIVLNSEFYYT